jgi:uncharacterized protein involved in exopolysaccharide biosynthesis
MTQDTPHSNDGPSIEELLASIHGLTQKAWKNRKLVLRYVALFTAFGLFYAIGSPVEYTAEMRIIPNKQGGNTTGLSGLAGIAGIRLPINSNDIIIAPDLYPEVSKSLDFRIAVAETPLVYSSHGKKSSLVDYFQDIYKPSATEKISSYTFGLPGRIIGLVSAARPTPVNPIKGDTSGIPRKYDSAYLGLVNSLEERLSLTIDKRSGILIITGKMPDPYAAADLVRVASARLTDQIAALESKKSTEHLQFVNDQFRQAKSRLENAQKNLAIFTDRNRALMSATSQIERNRLQQENDLAFELYQQFSRELDQARIKMNQDTPVFTVLESAIVPMHPSEPQRVPTVLMSIFLGVLAGLGAVAIQSVRESLSWPSSAVAKG